MALNKIPPHPLPWWFLSTMKKPTHPMRLGNLKPITIPTGSFAPAGYNRSQSRPFWATVKCVWASNSCRFCNLSAIRRMKIRFETHTHPKSLIWVQKKLFTSLSEVLGRTVTLELNSTADIVILQELASLWSGKLNGKDCWKLVQKGLRHLFLATWGKLKSRWQKPENS